MQELLPKSKELPCAFCSGQAVSICNLQAPSLPGCRAPFCQSHGIPHLRSRKKEADEERLALIKEVGGDLDPVEFRVCEVCLQPRITRSLFAYSMFTFLALAGVLSGVAGLILGKRESDCDPGLLLRVSDNECFFKRRLSEKEHLRWFEFQGRNPGVTECTIIRPGILAISEDPTLKGQWNIRCHCPDYYFRAWRAFDSDNNITRNIFCEVSSCPPNGTSFINNRDCIQGTPRPGSKCPAEAAFHTDLKLCVRDQVNPRHYWKNPKHFIFEPCPLFTTKPSTSDFICTYLKSPGGYTLEEKELKPDRRTAPCPPVPYLLTPEQQQAFERVGYYPRVVDSLGYWQCPKVGTLVRTNLTCSPEEMVIRYFVHCKSPCRLCLEKWDFAKMKCVLADSHCTQFGMRLATTGECYEALYGSALLKRHGEGFC